VNGKIAGYECEAEARAGQAWRKRGGNVFLGGRASNQTIKQATNPVFPYKTIAAPCQPTLAFLHRLVRRWPQVREKGCAPYCSAAGSALADS